MSANNINKSELDGTRETNDYTNEAASGSGNNVKKQQQRTIKSNSLLEYHSFPASVAAAAGAAAAAAASARPVAVARVEANEENDSQIGNSTTTCSIELQSRQQNKLKLSEITNKNEHLKKSNSCDNNNAEQTKFAAALKVKQLKQVKKVNNKQQHQQKQQMDQSEAGKELLSSQCGSSHASTSFVSSSIFGGSQSSSLEMNDANECLMNNNADETKKNEEKILIINNDKLINHCSLKKGSAISQSMLELDNSISCYDKFDVIWQNLTFSYEKSFQTRRRRLLRFNLGSLKNTNDNQLVLNNISGHFKSNELVAIIGPSGCGKTTLLQFLAGNQSAKQESVRIIGLDEPKVAFIGQDDNLLPGLSARETLLFASRLQNLKANFNHSEHIQPILNELGLTDCSQRIVTKLSGGQAKRVTIAQELLYPTNLLILDEVTSGLDASTSYSIVKLLKYLVSDCNYPMSIVMSIHQPSARLFSVFDRVYVMSEGQCLYEGSCQVEDVNNYLNLFNLKCPKFHNIADYLIEIACSTKSDEINSNFTFNNNNSRLEHENEHEGEVEGENAYKSLSSIYSIKEQMFEYQRKKNQNLLETIGKKYKFNQNFKQEKKREQSINFVEQKNISLDLKNNNNNQQKLNEQSVSLLPSNRNVDEEQQQQQQPHYSLYAAIERARLKRERPFCKQFLVHFNRSLVRIWRSPILTYLQLLTYVIMGLQLATFYGYDIGLLSGCPRFQGNLMTYILTSTTSSSSKSEQELDELSNEMRRIQENMNFLLVTVLTSTFAALEITVITFPMEAKTVKREWRNGWYKVTSYFMGRTLADLPFTIIFVLIYSILVYILTGQIGFNSWRFGIFFLIVLMTALIAQSFGFIFGALFMDNLPAAVFTAPLAIFPALLFSGFFSRISQIPSFYYPMTFISHFRYCFDALLITLYGFNRCECDQLALDNYHATLQNQTDSMRDMFQLLIGCETQQQQNNALETTTTTSASTTTSTTTLAPPPSLDNENFISRDDMAAISAANSSLGALLASTVAAQLSSTQSPLSLIQHNNNNNKNFASNPIINSLEDAILNGLFEQTNKSNGAGTGGQQNNISSNQFITTTMAPIEMINQFSDDETNSDHSLESMNTLDKMTYRFSTRVTRMLSKQSNFGHPMPRQCNQFKSYLMQEFDLHDGDLITSLIVLFIFVLVIRLICNLILNFTIARRTR